MGLNQICTFEDDITKAVLRVILWATAEKLWNKLAAPQFVCFFNVYRIGIAFYLDIRNDHLQKVQTTCFN